jgi:hypothetical protein
MSKLKSFCKILAKSSFISYENYSYEKWYDILKNYVYEKEINEFVYFMKILSNNIILDDINIINELVSIVYVKNYEIYLDFNSPLSLTEILFLSITDLLIDES